MLLRSLAPEIVPVSADPELEFTGLCILTNDGLSGALAGNAAKLDLA